MTTLLLLIAGLPPEPVEQVILLDGTAGGRQTYRRQWDGGWRSWCHLDEDADKDKWRPLTSSRKDARQAFFLSKLLRSAMIANKDLRPDTPVIRLLVTLSQDASGKTKVEIKVLEP